MECLKKQTLTEYSLNSLRAVCVSSPDEEYKNRVKKHWDDVAKPLDGMGDFEDLICKIGAIQRREDVKLDKKALLIMCADNGIVKEGVSQSDSSVTLSVARNMARGKSSVAVMAQKNGIDVFVYDVGIDTGEEFEGIINAKIRKGTNDFYKEPAMSEEETLKAINLGINLVKECVDKSYDIILTGEMGIGNTTTSAAVCWSLLEGDICKFTGRGAGLDDEKFLNKKRIIRESIEKYSLKSADAFRILKTVGGFDIASRYLDRFGQNIKIHIRGKRRILGECLLPQFLSGLLIRDSDGDQIGHTSLESSIKILHIISGKYAHTRVFLDLLEKICSLCIGMLII